MSLFSLYLTLELSYICTYFLLFPFKPHDMFSTLFTVWAPCQFWCAFGANENAKFKQKHQEIVKGKSDTKIQYKQNPYTNTQTRSLAYIPTAKREREDEKKTNHQNRWEKKLWLVQITVLHPSEISENRKIEDEACFKNNVHNISLERSIFFISPFSKLCIWWCECFVFQHTLSLHFHCWICRCRCHCRCRCPHRLAEHELRNGQTHFQASDSE